MLSNQFKWSLMLLMLIFICSACQTNNSQEDSSSSIPLNELILLSEKGNDFPGMTLKGMRMKMRDQDCISENIMLKGTSFNS